MAPLAILVFFFSITLSGQQNRSLDLKEKSENDLFQKDWSNLDHLIAGKVNIEHHDAPKLELKSDIKLKDLVSQDIAEADESNRKTSKMPIHKPTGNHHMPVHEIDSKGRYYLKILTVE